MQGKHHDRFTRTNSWLATRRSCAGHTAQGCQSLEECYQQTSFYHCREYRSARADPIGNGRTNARTQYLITITQRLAPEVEALTQRAIPTGWQLLHGCLYYALAGQYLLARYGIDTQLKGGTVVYFPTSPLHHRIKPHVWLETVSHYIDFSALPRWGYTVVLPMRAVAHDSASILPGLTEVLILEERNDPQFSSYVSRHRARFENVLKGRKPDDD